MKAKNKISKKGIKSVSQSKGKVENEGNVQSIENTEKSFQHGGLPLRDLKKNLGCG